MTDALDIEQARPRVAPDESCAHCGLPVGTAPIGSDPYFCCTGCQVVFSALHDAGLAGTYYRLGADALRPAPSVELAGYAALDAPEVMAQVAKAQPDGTCRATLHVEGVHCAACVWLVERLPHTVPGVLGARLNLTRGRLDLTFDPARARLSGVARWLGRFGYRVVPAPADGVAVALREERRLLVRMGISWALAGNAMLLAFAFYSGLDAAQASINTFARWLSLLLATTALFVGGPLFFRRAWTSLRAAVGARDWRMLHLDLPLSIGILGGYAHGAYATLTGAGEVWFDSLLVLMAALLTARWLNLRALRHAREAADRLLTLLPTLVTRVLPDGETETVAATALQPGDVVRVGAGDVLPADGVVVDGESTLDRSVLTGESEGIPTGAGDRVEAGATNLRAPLYVRVEAAGDDTRVGRLLALVREGADTEAPTVRLADRLAPYYVIVTLMMAGLAFLVLGPSNPDAWQRVVALLVITCPCALGMATPLTFAVAIGRAARGGLFVKHEAVLETLPKTTAIVLDKTGTLTEGRLTLATTRVTHPNALHLAAALERESTHPIARALVSAFPQAQALPAARNVEAIAGHGLLGEIGEFRVQVGRPGWIAAHADVPEEMRREVESVAEQGLTPVAIAVDGRVEAIAGFGDTLRPDARAFVAAMQRSGKEVHLLSGDAPGVVTRVAEALGIRAQNAQGGVMPEEKAERITEIAREHTVVMVGDGVNDAAALQAAHVGVAVAGGTSVSIVAADVFATSPGLAPLQALFRGAARATRRVRALLVFSVAYNVAGVALALAGFVTPLVAAVAMPVSSLTVVAGALLQRSFTDPQA